MKATTASSILIAITFALRTAASAAPDANPVNHPSPLLSSSAAAYLRGASSSSTTAPRNLQVPNDTTCCAYSAGQADDVRPGRPYKTDCDQELLGRCNRFDPHNCFEAMDQDDWVQIHGAPCPLAVWPINNVACGWAYTCC